MSDFKKSVCVDLDGVLADYRSGWQGLTTIGDPIPGAVEFTKELGKFATVVIFTTRCKGKMFDRDERPEFLADLVAAWLKKHGFYYDEIYIGQGKPIASAYVDDRAVLCNPQDSLMEQVDGGPNSAFPAALRNVKELCNH